MTIMAPPPPDDGDQQLPLDNVDASLNGLLRDVRVKAQTAHDAIRRMTSAAHAATARVRDQQLRAAFEIESPVLDEMRQELGRYLEEAASFVRSAPALHDRIGDEVTRIVDLYVRCSADWPVETDTGADLLQRLERLEPLFCDMIYHCGLVTIPSRVNQHLRTLRVGQRLDMTRTFRDELCDPGDLGKILQYLWDHPATVEGIVDVHAGVILRASQQPWRRRATFLLLVALLARGGAVAFACPYLASLAGIAGWDGSVGTALRSLSLYGALLFGAVAHVGIDALKQYRASSGADMLALEDWLLWVHVKETSNVVSVASIWVVYFGLAVWTPSMDLPTAFFAGYSLDSVMELFLQRFSTTASAGAKAAATAVAG